MRESCQIVRIEKHRVGDITALTFAQDPCETESSRPLVFVLHGLMSRKERQIELCLSLAGAGFLACTLDARFHGERATPEAAALLSGEMNGAFLDTFAEAVIGTVADVAALTSYFGRERYGVAGHSMGAYIALKTAVTDPRAAVVVSIAGNPDWTLVPEGVRLPLENLEHARAESPLTHAERFWPRPLLLLHGDADTTVPVGGSRRLYSTLLPRYAPDPARLSLVEYPGVRHDLLPDMAARTVDWMQRFLPDGSGSSFSGIVRRETV